MLAADTPTVTVSDGRGGHQREPYSAFRRRAFARESIARLDARIGALPPDERGQYVFVGWSIYTGQRWPAPVRMNDVSLNVWRSNDREAPFASAVSDPRYWRGDQYWFWHRSRFPEARAWPRVEQPAWVRTPVPFSIGLGPVGLFLSRASTASVALWIRLRIRVNDRAFALPLILLTRLGRYACPTSQGSVLSRPAFRGKVSARAA